MTFHNKSNKSHRWCYNGLDAPKWNMNSVKKFAGQVGQPASIVCVVDAFPSAAFYWMNQLNVNITPTSGVTIAPSVNSSILTFASLEQAGFANYTCVAYNIAGQSRFVLPVQPPGTCYLFCVDHCRPLWELPPAAWLLPSYNRSNKLLSTM